MRRGCEARTPRCCHASIRRGRSRRVRGRPPAASEVEGQCCCRWGMRGPKWHADSGLRSCRRSLLRGWWLRDIDGFEVGHVARDGEYHFLVLHILTDPTLSPLRLVFTTTAPSPIAKAVDTLTNSPCSSTDVIYYYKCTPTYLLRA